MSQNYHDLTQDNEPVNANVQLMIGGTMPEDLPTPERSIQELQREEQQRIKPGQQLTLLDESDIEKQ